MGYPSTGLQYHAFDWGPVPGDFWHELKQETPPKDFKGTIVLNKVIDIDEPSRFERKVQKNPKAKVDKSVFSEFELKILEEISFIYRDATAKEMSSISHKDWKPWKTTYNGGLGRNQPIDYLLEIVDQVDSDELELIKESLREFFAVLDNYNLKPTT